MTNKKFSILFCLLAIGIWPCVLTAQVAPRLLPFQGRLTDQNGVAVSNGVRLVQFKIFDVPAGGSPVWAGELHRTTVNGGLVNVLLGSKTPFAGVDFDKQLYLEITVDINADNTITAADPPMLPRQAILPVIFAKEAADSRLLDGHDWSSIMAGGSSNPSTSVIAETKLPSGIAMPVGGVIMWWGTIIGIPKNFELCDGAIPTSPGAVLLGNKPDLRDRFVKGAQAAVTDVATAPVLGGANTISTRLSGDTTLTESQIPAHPHSVNITTRSDGAHSHQVPTQGAYGTFGVLAIDAAGFNGGNARGTDTQGSHTHSVVGSTDSAGGGQAHNHSIAAHDNRPAFVELFYIIRVK